MSDLHYTLHKLRSFRGYVYIQIMMLLSLVMQACIPSYRVLRWEEGKVQGKPRLQSEFKGSLDNWVRFLFRVKSKNRVGAFGQWQSACLIDPPPVHYQCWKKSIKALLIINFLSNLCHSPGSFLCVLFPVPFKIPNYKKRQACNPLIFSPPSFHPFLQTYPFMKRRSL